MHFKKISKIALTKKYIFETAPLNTKYISKIFSKLLSQKNKNKKFNSAFSKKEHFQSCSLKIALSKNTFSKLTSQKYILKTAPSRNTFQKHIFKILF